MIIFEKILHMASQTPSGDNLQPWFFKLDEAAGNLFIYHDYRLGKHNFNPENITSCLSFGMMLFLIEEEALRQGYTTCIDVNEVGLTDNKDWFIRCHFGGNNTPKRALFSTEETLKRKTVRHKFIKRLIPLGDLNHLLEDFNKSNSLINFKIKEDISPTLLGSMKKMESEFWNKKSYLKEIFKWVHFSESNYQKMKRGFHWKELGIKISDIPFVFILKYLTGLGIVLYNLVAKLVVFSKFKEDLKNANFILLSLKQRPSTLEWLDIGKAVMHLWVKIGQLEMVTQPLSIHTFFVSYARWGIKKSDWSPNVINLQERALQDHFHVAANFTPFWLFRFGYEDKQLASYPSLKLSTKETLR